MEKIEKKVSQGGFYVLKTLESTGYTNARAGLALVKLPSRALLSVGGAAAPS